MDLITLTASGQYYVVYRAGAKVSQHTTEREAIQKCGELLLQYPTETITYRHEYTVNATMPVLLVNRLVPRPDVTAPTAPTISAAAASSSSIIVTLVSPALDTGSGVKDYQLEYKRSVDSTWSVDGAALPASSFPRTIAALTAATGYDVRARAADFAGNVGAYSATASATTDAASQSSPQFSENPYRLLTINAGANPFRGTNVPLDSGAKHVALAWHPVKKRVYTFGGDYDAGPSGLGQPEPGALFTTNAPSGANTWRRSSGYQLDQFSIDPYAAAPISWRLEHPFKIINQGGVPEQRPPVNCQSSLVYDSLRGKFWGLQTFIRGYVDLTAAGDPLNRYAEDPWAGGTLWTGTKSEPSGIWSFVPGASGSPGTWTRETTNALVYRQGASDAAYEGGRLVTGAGDERIAHFAYSAQHDRVVAISSYVGSIKLWIFNPNDNSLQHRTIPKTGYDSIITTSSQIAVLGDWVYAVGLANPTVGANNSVLLRANLTNALALANGATLADNIANWEAFDLPFSLSSGAVWESSGDYTQKWSEHAGCVALEGKIVVAVTYDSVIDGGVTKIAAFAPSNKQIYQADSAPEDFVANAWCDLPDSAEILMMHASPGAYDAEKYYAYRVSHLGPLALDSFEIVGTDNLPGSAFDAVSGTTYVTSKPRWWMYSHVTKDGTIIRLGDDAHGQSPPQWNGVREFNPVTGTTTNVYANNFARADANRMNNQAEFYIPAITYLGQTRDLFVRSPGQNNGVWDRSTSTWVIGSLPPASNNGREIVGVGTQDLMYQDPSVSAGNLNDTYNPHFAWSATHGCGIMIGGSPAGNGAPFQKMWLIVPSHSGINATAVSQGNPLTIYEKTLPNVAACVSQWGEPVYRMRAAMACCFAGDYVYWFGGDPYGDDPPGPDTSKALFRMKITPHLTSKSASVTSGDGVIQRLTDAPVDTNFGLLTYDRYLNCLVAWCGVASTACIWAYDLTYAGVDGVGTWVNVTPPTWTSAGSFGNDPFSPPVSCQGGFVETVSGQPYRRHVFSPGRTSYGATNMESFFALKLKRR